MPGLVDSHIHAWEGQPRGLSPEAGFEDYLTHSRKQADIVLLRADTLHHAPLNNITARLGVL